MQSIYQGKNYANIHGFRNLAAAYGMELSTCEDLISMGYKSCNGVSLGSRADYLAKEIERLEKLAKGLGL